MHKNKAIVMITNQVLNREGIAHQRTKDGYFNATSLLDYWNRRNPDNHKQIGNYKKNSGTMEFVNYLKECEGIDQPIISTRGYNSCTWMHPKIFIDFAMWVSIEFKSKVIDWVLDGLVPARHSAGDYYKEMCAAIMTRYIDYYGRKPETMTFVNEARLIRSLCGIEKNRNELTEAELQKITAMQKINSTLILDGVGKESRKKHLSIVARSL